MSPAEFCDRHRACDDVRAWAIATGCATMAELWEREDLRIDWRIWIFSRAASAGEIRLFAVFCARRVAHLNPDPRVAAAIEVAERYARGEASDQELAAAWASARDAAWAAAWAAASDAVSAAWAAEEKAQSDYLRAMPNPFAEAANA